jgi:glutathione S-transferase
MLARLDFLIGTIQQTRGKSAAAIAAYVKAKDQFAALRTEAPNDVFVLRWAAGQNVNLAGLDNLARFVARMEADPAVQNVLREESAR